MLCQDDKKMCYKKLFVLAAEVVRSLVRNANHQFIHETNTPCLGTLSLRTSERQQHVISNNKTKQIS